MNTTAMKIIVTMTPVWYALRQKKTVECQGHNTTQHNQMAAILIDDINTTCSKNSGMTNESSRKVACEYYDNPSYDRLASGFSVMYALRTKYKLGNEHACHG